MIIVDRILNNLAVCEVDGKMQDIPLSSIDGDVREGSVLIADKTGVRYLVDAVETEKRRNAITERFNRIKAKNKRFD